MTQCDYKMNIKTCQNLNKRNHYQYIKSYINIIS